MWQQCVKGPDCIRIYLHTMFTRNLRKFILRPTGNCSPLPNVGSMLSVVNSVLLRLPYTVAVRKLCNDAIFAGQKRSKQKTAELGQDILVFTKFHHYDLLRFLSAMLFAQMSI